MVKNFKKKVLMIWTDTHKVWWGLFKYFDNNYDFYLALPNYDCENIPKLKNDVIKLEFKKSYIKSHIKNLSKILNSICPDIIITYHLYELYTLQIIFTKDKKIPLFILDTLHQKPGEWDTKPHRYLKLIFKLLTPFFKILNNKYKKRFNFKIINLITTSYDYMKSIGFKDLLYVPMPYYGFFSNKQEYNTKKVEMVYVGRFTQMKNIFILLEAIKQLRDESKLKNFTLSIYGFGDKEQEIKSFIEDSKLKKIIIFKGKIAHEKLNEEYKKYNYFVLPSFDVLGLVVLEAMEIGLPVLVSKSVGLASHVKGGVNGFLFDPKNIKDIKQKLSQIIKDKSKIQKIGLNSKKQIKKINKEWENKFKFIFKK